MPELSEQEEVIAQNAFDALHALITKRQLFEATHQEPPYTQFKTTYNFADIHGWGILHYATKLGDLDTVKDLIENKGFDQYNYFTPEQLPNSSEAAATFTKQSVNGFTHLHIAALTHSKSNLQ